MLGSAWRKIRTYPTEALEILARNDNPYVKVRAEKTLKRLDLERKLQVAEANQKKVTDVIV